MKKSFVLMTFPLVIMFLLMIVAVPFLSAHIALAAKKPPSKSALLKKLKPLSAKARQIKVSDFHSKPRRTSTLTPMGHRKPRVKNQFGGIIPPPGGLGAPPPTTFPCESPTFPYRCFTPHDIVQAYNTHALQTAGGAGMSITILDAFSDPTLAADLSQFDLLFTLPDPPPIAVFSEGGLPLTIDPTGSAATEITLDVEWAHALAPKAKINLVLAQSFSELDIFNITQFAVTNNLGNIISQSYGENEGCDPVFVSDMDVLFQIANAQNQTLVAASGDTGAAVPSCPFPTNFVQGINFPASDPLSLSVGGTTLYTDAAQTYAGELVWNTQKTPNPPTADDSGGGVSTVFGVPGYQGGIAGLTGRGVPDVAYDADPNSGVFVVCSSCGFGPDALMLVGGTSVAAPQWAGIIADAAELKGHPLGLVNPPLYSFFMGGALLTHNVFLGNNTYSFTDGGVTTTITGFNAEVPMWNAAIGLGTPKGDKIAVTLG